MQILMKHQTLGNIHCDESEQAEREKAGWVRWPRTAAQKAGVAVVLVAAPELTSRDSLEKTAELLEIHVDGRWSDARLAKEIEKVEADLRS